MTGALQSAQTDVVNKSWLSKLVPPEGRPTAEAQQFLLPLVPVLEVPDTQAAWEAQAQTLRKRMLDEVYLENVPESWLKPELNVVWGDTIQHEGYVIHKLRYEVVPGLWLACRYL